MRIMCHTASTNVLANTSGVALLAVAEDWCVACMAQHRFSSEHSSFTMLITEQIKWHGYWDNRHKQSKKHPRCWCHGLFNIKIREYWLYLGEIQYVYFLLLYFLLRVKTSWGSSLICSSSDHCTKIAVFSQTCSYNFLGVKLSAQSRLVSKP